MFNIFPVQLTVMNIFQYKKRTRILSHRYTVIFINKKESAQKYGKNGNKYPRTNGKYKPVLTDMSFLLIDLFIHLLYWFNFRSICLSTLCG